MAQKETRAAAKVRLQAEGRWKEALSLRERLKAEGVAPLEAWRRMVDAFPPLANGQAAAAPPIETAMPESAPVKRRRRRRRTEAPTDWRREIEWVYLNLDEESDDGRAPSGGAMVMLTWAKKNPADFVKTCLVKLLPSKSEQEAEAQRRVKELQASLVDLENEKRSREYHLKKSQEEQRALVRTWTIEECRLRLAEAEAGIDHNDSHPRDKAPARPEPPVVPVQPPAEPPLRAPPPNTVTPCPHGNRLGPGDLCNACEYHRHYAEIESARAGNKMATR